MFALVIWLVFLAGVVFGFFLCAMLSANNAMGED